MGNETRIAAAVARAEAALRDLVSEIVRHELAKAALEPAAPDHVTVAEYARARSISESTVRAAIREGRLEVIRIGRAVRVPANANIGKRVQAVSATERATERATAKLLGRAERVDRMLSGTKRRS